MNEIYKDLKKPDSATEKKKELEKKQIQDEKIKANKLRGEVIYDNSSLLELIVYYDKQKEFKYIRFI